jgi:hypothetical protein
MEEDNDGLFSNTMSAIAADVFMIYGHYLRKKYAVNIE